MKLKKLLFLAMAAASLCALPLMASCSVGAETGTTGLDWAKENLTDAQEIVAFDEYPAVFAALQSGQVVTAAIDDAIAQLEADGTIDELNQKWFGTNA